MFNIPQIEEKILKFWQEKKIFQQSLQKESPKGIFVFYEGPPTANGKPGIHHVEARVFKDLIPRYKTMAGFKVERQAGWDTHGLPVELEVEKKLGLKNKKEVEDYGIREFNQKCKESVWLRKEEWEKMTERIGFWLDMENPYITYDNNYIESLWWIIKQIYDKGLMYQGHKVIPQCPRCGTALSSHEVAQGYRTVTEESVTVKFQIANSLPTGDHPKGDKSQINSKFQIPNAETYILAWTTTPWTLPGNVALAVRNDVDYVMVEYTGLDIATKFTGGRDVTTHQPIPYANVPFQYLIVSQVYREKLEREHRVKLTEINKFKGIDLVGLEYEPLFPGAIPESTKNYANAFKVYVADFVSTEDGTGVVHTAVMYGQDDYELGEKVGLPKIHTVNLDGTFNELVPQWQGKFVKSVEKEITADLESRGLLFNTEPHSHDYPFCWRCDTPLIYYAKESWFFKMSALREQLIKNNATINWVPGHIKEGRFGEWLKEVKDWAISRERYWGTPLPVWQCVTENTKTQKAHKTQNGCGYMIVVGSFEELERLSGQKIQDPHRPFIDEITFKCGKCGGEMRRVPEVMDCWFDSGAMPFAQLHYPFENRNLIDCGADSRGLSTRTHAEKCLYPANFISEAIDQTRGWFYTLLAVATLLGREAPYKNVICLGHILDKKGQKMSKHIGNVVDPWLMIEKYGADIIRWYLYSVNQPGEPKRFDESFLKESGRMFTTLVNVLSFYQMYTGHANIDADKSEYHANNFNNILDEWIVAKLNLLVKEVTANLDNYDIFSAARKTEDFINDLSTWYVRRSRERFKGEDKLDKNAALSTLRHVLLELSKLMAPFTPFIAEYLYQELKGEKESVHLEEWPTAREELINQKTLRGMNSVRQVVELGLAKRAEAGIKIRQPLAKLKIGDEYLDLIKDEYLDLIKDELNVKEIEQEMGGGEFRVELDTTLTDELKEEGIARELIRTINNLRKEMKLTIQDRVKILYHTDDEVLKQVFVKHAEELKQETLASEIDMSDDKLEKVKVNETEVGLKIDKI